MFWLVDIYIAGFAFGGDVYLAATERSILWAWAAGLMLALLVTNAILLAKEDQ